MKAYSKILKLFILALTLSFFSCQTNEDIATDATVNSNAVDKNSVVSSLMQRVATNDGSADNIIDRASCLTVKLPVTVIVNGQQVDVQSAADFLTIEDIFDQFDDDTDVLEIQYPITVVKSDFTEVMVNDANELAILADTCPQENEVDLDIECIDFQYPISGSILDASNQVINTITINNDNELYDFLENFDPNTSIVIDFPVSMIIPDGTILVINDLVELENAIVTYEDTCDEDDDNDYNDDDCTNCTDTQLIQTITSCNSWIIDEIERNGNDLSANYTGYNFEFLTNGTVNVSSANDSYSGSWSVSGTDNSITVSLNINGLADFNGDWMLHEIEQEAQEPTEISLEIGNDELSLKSGC